jgi:hypothetical protein
MKKVHDKELEEWFEGLLKDKKVIDKPHAIVEALKLIQDAGGMKVCQNVNPEDAAYKEVGKYGSNTKTD